MMVDARLFEDLSQLTRLEEIVKPSLHLILLRIDAHVFDVTSRRRDCCIYGFESVMVSARHGYSFGKQCRIVSWQYEPDLRQKRIAVWLLESSVSKHPYAFKGGLSGREYTCINCDNLDIGTQSGLSRLLPGLCCLSERYESQSPGLARFSMGEPPGVRISLFSFFTNQTWQHFVCSL